MEDLREELREETYVHARQGLAKGVARLRQERKQGSGSLGGLKVSRSWLNVGSLVPAVEVVEEVHLSENAGDPVDAVCDFGDFGVLRVVDVGNC